MCIYSTHLQCCYSVAGQTRRLRCHGGVGPASSQCTYTVHVSITMVRLIMCSTRTRCTSTRWIHSDYRFWVSLGIHLQFCFKFWTNLSNSSHTVRRLKFHSMSSFSASFHTTFVLEVFFLVVIGNSIYIRLYTGNCMYVCSYLSLSSKLTGRSATLLTTVFGGYQKWAAMPRDRFVGFNGYRRRAATWWLQLDLCLAVTRGGRSSGVW
jgi:hypothetical protein